MPALEHFLQETVLAQAFPMSSRQVLRAYGDHTTLLKRTQYLERFSQFVGRRCHRPCSIVRLLSCTFIRLFGHIIIRLLRRMTIRFIVRRIRFRSPDIGSWLRPLV